jgi:hypothetical protein
MPTDERAQPTKRATPRQSEPSREAISKRAYELYLRRGSVPGYETEDWLQAEAELVAEIATATNETR